MHHVRHIRCVYIDGFSVTVSRIVWTEVMKVSLIVLPTPVSHVSVTPIDAVFAIPRWT